MPVRSALAGRFRTQSKSISTAQVAIGGTSIQALTVTGLSTSMVPVVVIPAAITAGVVYSYAITAANTLRMVFYNPSAAAWPATNPTNITYDISVL